VKELYSSCRAFKNPDDSRNSRRPPGGRGSCSNLLPPLGDVPPTYIPIYPYRYRWIPARYKSLAFNGAIEAAAFWHLISGSVADAKYSSLFLVLDREQV